MDTLYWLILVLIVFGIAKDIYLFTRWLDSWLNRNDEHKLPVTKDELQEVRSDIKDAMDARFEALIIESRKTNDLLFKFLLSQKIIAKTVYKLDLDI